jgi:hypothetical protein
MNDIGGFLHQGTARATAWVHGGGTRRLSASQWQPLLALLVALASCTHNTTLVPGGPDAGQIVYRLSEQQAFTIARGVFAELLPERKLFDITGNRRGYWTTYRFGIDRYSQKVLVIPALGADPQGREVRGYWFDVSGRGTAVIAGSMKNRALFHRLQEVADATGTATARTTDTAERLRQLRSMREEGLITPAEYEAKRREMLDRM